MLAVSSYPPEYVKQCRANVDDVVKAYKKVATAATGDAAPSFEPPRALAETNVPYPPGAPPPPAPLSAEPPDDVKPAKVCPCCGGRMILVEVFARGAAPRTAPARPVIGIDSS